MQNDLMSALVWLGCFVVTALTGCSGNPPVYPVEGRVTISDGTPLRGGVIILESFDRQKINARGMIDDNGAYRITTFVNDDGAMAGKHRVMFCPAISVEGIKKYEDTIHDRYLDFDTSEVVMDVSPDAKPNHFDFKLDPPERDF